MDHWQENLPSDRVAPDGRSVSQNEGTEDQSFRAFIEGHDQQHYHYFPSNGNVQSGSLNPSQHAQNFHPIHPWSPLNLRANPDYVAPPSNPINQEPLIPDIMQPMQGHSFYQSPGSHQHMHSFPSNEDLLSYPFASGPCEHPHASSEPEVENHNNNNYLGVLPDPPTSLSDRDELLSPPMVEQATPEAQCQSPDTRHDDSNHLSPPFKREGTSPLPSTRRRAKSTTIPDELGCPIDDCTARFHGEYRKSNLARHIRLRHDRGGRTYACEGGCGKIFNRQDARLKHYRRQHPHLASAPPIPRKN
ncbi:hypothetical protein DM02DRAFT_722749 [Periconia macrospinosa]|uniref:C2H2-type domain-containing protein n=1 Tax=Periconia macrospinosa TaxID=97972 RepID=A0A2V1EEP1_9PLEO|nr:hypothetical protein DM02DRAFT_722749 [Periconia macrospinosa]